MVIITDKLSKEEVRQVGFSIVYLEDVHHYSSRRVRDAVVCCRFRPVVSRSEVRQDGSFIVYLEDVHHYSPEEGSRRGRLLPLPPGRIKVGSASVLGQQYPITVPVPATFL